MGREHLLRGTDARMDAIAWGVLAALAFHHSQTGGAKWLDKVARNSTPIIALAVFVAVLLIPSEWIGLRMILQPLCAVAVILWGLLPNDTPFQDSVYRAVSWGWVQFIGLASYSLYIAHDVVMAPLRTVFERWPLALSGGWCCSAVPLRASSFTSAWNGRYWRGVDAGTFHRSTPTCGLIRQRYPMSESERRPRSLVYPAGLSAH